MLLEKNTGGSLSLDGEETVLEMDLIPLDGKDLKLKKVSLGKKELKEGEYALEKEKLLLGRSMCFASFQDHLC